MTPRRQPALAALVADVAAELGQRSPQRVWLAAGPTARLVTFPARRPHLYLGHPYVRCLSGPELRTVVAHELAHVPVGVPHLARRVLEPRMGQAERFAGLRPAEARPLANAVKLAADATVTRLVGVDLAGRALARSHLLGEAFGWFMSTCVVPMLRAGLYPIDLYDGWEEKLAQPSFAAEMGSRVLGLLADEAGELAAGRLLAPSSLPVPLVPLDPAVKDRLVRALLGVGRFRGPRGVTFADPVVLDAYDADLAQAYDALRTAAREVLGQPEMTDGDIHGLVLGPRRRELHRALDAVEPDRVDPVAVLTLLYSSRLRRAGYRYESALLRDVLRPPDGGEPIDVAALARVVAADPADEAARVDAVALLNLGQDPAPVRAPT
ncbi:MAG TPA: hypothetical protein VLJ59_20105 [Mycobacteriales bacterium]|nr:hypothetical protein [Mycobacteriales bacterium]